MTKIFVCKNITSSDWNLGQIHNHDSHLLAIGWNHPDSKIDAGVPKSIAMLIAHALISFHELLFFISEDEIPQISRNEGTVFPLRKNGFFSRLRLILKYGTRPLNMILTASQDVACRAFDQAEFNWSMQGQLILCTAKNSNPLDLDLETVDKMLSENWTKESADFNNPDLLAIIRPGVDGDILGVLPLNIDYASQLIESLKRSCEKSKTTFEIAENEEIFKDLLAQKYQPT